MNMQGMRLEQNQIVFIRTAVGNKLKGKIISEIFRKDQVLYNVQLLESGKLIVVESSNILLE